VSANGAYTLNVPANAGPTLIQALDAKGNAVVSALLEDPIVAGVPAKIQPMTTQSSVQAAIVLAMAKAGTAVSSIDLAALRAMIDPTTAQVVHDHAADVASQATADIAALGVATLAAQASLQASLKAAGVNLTTFQADELTAANTLTAALDANYGAATEAEATFTASLLELETKLGLDAAAEAKATTNATASAIAAINASSTSVDLTDAFQVTLGKLESVTATAAISAAFTSADASSNVMAQVQSADANLTSQVASATTAASVTSAFATWRAALHGTSASADGLLGTMLGDTITTDAGYASTMSAILALQPTLQAALTSSVAASESSAHVINPTTLAGLVSNAFATYDSGVQTAVSSSTVTLAATDSTLLTSVFVSSTTSF
jgi:hypothetical protein